MWVRQRERERQEQFSLSLSLSFSFSFFEYHSIIDITITNYTKDNNKLIGNIINDIDEDSKGNIWVCTNKGITVIKKDEIVNITSKNGLPSDYTTAIEEDANGNYFIGTNKGIIKLLAGSITDNTFEFDKKLFKGMNAEITDILLDKEKNIWISTNDAGAYLLKDNETITHISKKNGLITNSLLT